MASLTAPLERTSTMRRVICGWALPVETLRHRTVGRFVMRCGWKLRTGGRGRWGGDTDVANGGR
uniref:Uncharacterized protein n=1 Tax=Leersia perrieri TaxID=77586 RepID=A0A0D9WP95_9ORYZ